MSIPVVIPTSRTVRLRYVSEVNLNPISNSIAAYYFRANSLFDPDFTSTGHQPMGFDQIALGYDHYTVTGSKITIRALKSTSVQSLPAMYGCFLDNNTTLTYTQGDQVLEAKHNQRGSASWRVSPGLEEGSVSGKPGAITLGFGAKKFFGVKDLSSAQFRPLVTANPVDEAFFCLWAANIDGNDPASWAFMCEIDYVATFSERKFHAQS